jgi:hypothetical protein
MGTIATIMERINGLARMEQMVEDTTALLELANHLQE